MKPIFGGDRDHPDEALTDVRHLGFSAPVGAAILIGVLSGASVVWATTTGLREGQQNVLAELKLQNSQIVAQIKASDERAGALIKGVEERAAAQIRLLDERVAAQIRAQDERAAAQMKLLDERASNLNFKIDNLTREQRMQLLAIEQLNKVKKE